MDTRTCSWVLSLLMERKQTDRVGSSVSKFITANTGSPQGCVLSPLLFTLLTHDCIARYNTNHIIKFADDTTVIRLISESDESAYRAEVGQLTKWCKRHNLALSVDKMKEMVIDFRWTGKLNHMPLISDGATVEKASHVKFLGVHLADDRTLLSIPWP